MSVDRHLLDSLTAWLRNLWGNTALRITCLDRLPGGAIQQNWRLVTEDGGVSSTWLLRTDGDALVAASGSRAHEFGLLSVAAAAGVCVPAPRALCTTVEVIGKPFFITDFVEGIATPHLLVRDDTLVPDRSALAFALGQNLARIHAIPTSTAELSFLGPVPDAPTLEQVRVQRQRLDEIGAMDLPLEFALRELELQAPSEEPVRLLHRDFRSGNYMVHEGRLAAVLDWEFAGWGNPLEDIGWFTAKCWRFGQAAMAGGVGPLESFLDGYRSSAEWAPEANALAYWQKLAHARWAVIAHLQAHRHLSGRERSLELLLTGRIPSQLHLEMLIEGPA